AEQAVVPRAADDLVGTRQAADGVVAPGAVDLVPLVGADDDVVARRADGPLRGSLRRWDDDDRRRLPVAGRRWLRRTGGTEREGRDEGQGQQGGHADRGRG